MRYFRARAWVIIFAVWTVFGLISAAQSHYRFALAGRTLSWTAAIIAEVSFCWLWALFTPVIFLIGRRFPVRSGAWLRPILIHLLCALMVTAVTKVIWEYTMVPWVFGKPAPTDAEGWIRSLLMAVDYGLLQYGMVSVTQHAILYLRRAEEDRMRATRLEAELARAQLAALKMQLQPHFLFNTLHAITELIEQEPEKAERMVVRLSELLRYTMDQLGVHEVSLQQELEFLKRYLEIEKIRFEDRLQVEYEIEPASLQAQVPNFLLQPLVENALRHGIESQNRPGVLRIGTRVAGETLAVQVFDTGPGVARPDQIREGVGLGNTRRRLERLFGAQQRLELTNVKNGGFSVTVEIPLRLMA